MRLFLLSLLCLTALPVLATPSGLMWIPNTDIQPYQVWHIDSDALLYTNGGDTGAFADEGVEYGALPELELGVDTVNNFINIQGAGRNPFWFNGKYQLITPSAMQRFALAVGVEYVGVQSSSNIRQLYVVGSYRFDGLRFTAGGYSASQSVVGHDNTGVLLGLDYSYGKWWYDTDYQSGHNLIGTYNVGVGYNFTDKLELLVGMTFFNAADLVGANSALNVQVDINI